MNIEAIEKLNEEIKEAQVKLDDSLESLNNIDLNKQDILINFLKISITALIGFLIFSNLSNYVFSLIENGRDVRTFIWIIINIFTVLFIYFPLISLSKKQIKETKDFFKKKCYDKEFNNLMIIFAFSLIPLFLSFLFSARSYYSGDEDMLKTFGYSIKLFFEFGIFGTLFLFLITSIYHYNTTVSYIKSKNFKEKIINEVNYYTDKVLKYSNEMDNLIRKETQTYEEIEMLKTFSKAANLNTVLNTVLRLQEDIAISKGYSDYKEMEKKSISNKISNQNITNINF